MDIPEVRQIVNLAENNRSLLAQAMLEDEAVRKASEIASENFMDKVEDEKNEMPFWMWCVLYFCLGMLFTMTIPALGNLLWSAIHGSW